MKLSPAVVRLPAGSLLLPLLLCLPLAAQETAADTAEHEALRGLRALYERAVNENQVDLLEPHLHPQFSGVMLTGEPVGGMEEVRQYWANIRKMMGEGGKYTVKLDPETSMIYGDIAIARGTTEDVVVTGAGTEYRFDSGWTAVCKKEGGQWKILRIQGTMDPIGNPFVLAAVKGTMIGSSATGGGIGLVLGIILTLLLRRRRPAAA